MGVLQVNGFPVYVGYDPRECDAYDVCAYSLERHSSIPLKLMSLDLRELRGEGLYRRASVVKDRQNIDIIDGKPFSTEFSFSRFLVPYLNGYDGWAMFVDCDFLFTDDIAKLIWDLDDGYAAMCVKHKYAPKPSMKMDGRKQEAYPKKLWSSLVMWNCSHHSNAELTPRVVNTKTGSWLHGFSWLREDEIGAIDSEWNWIPGVSRERAHLPSGIHYSLGTPDMAGYEDCKYADLWRQELRRVQAPREMKFKTALA